MGYYNKFPNFKKQNLVNEIGSATTAIVIIYLIGYIFNILADYRGITLLPGIRKGFSYIVNHLIDDNILFFHENIIEWKWGIGGIEVILCLVWFLQAKLLFQLLVFKTKTRKIKQEIKKQAIDTGKLIVLTTAMNIIPIVLLNLIK